MKARIRGVLAGIVSPTSLLPEGPPPGWPSDLPPPAVWVAPETEEEVAGVLEKASGEGWRVLPSGAGSWLRGAGGEGAEILLSTRRLSGVSFYEPADLTLTAGSGIPFEKLQETTAEHGQWIPLDPPGWASGTLGGLVATGRAGPLRHAFGSPRDHVLGLTLVAGNGSVLRWGGRVVKNVAGFDVTRLSIGSWGSLGVITSVSARLFPLPEADRTILLTGSSMEEVLPVARMFSASSLPLSAVEVVESCPMPGTGMGTGAAVVLRLLGSPLQVEEMEGRVRGLAGGERGLSLLKGEGSRAFHGALATQEEGAHLVLRLSLLPAKAELLLDSARGLARSVGGAGALGVRWALHLGSGVLRMSFHGSALEGVSPAVLERALSEARRFLQGEGGSLVLSEGPSKLVSDVGGWGTPGPEISLMRGLKGVFDPAGILPSGSLGG